MTKQPLEVLATEIRTSSDKRQRVIHALADTVRYIEKEDPRSADTRPAQVAKTLADYKAHAEYLRTALDMASAA